MITFTDTARSELEAYFADKEKGTIRIYLAQGGCSGPRLAMALDEPSADDKVFETDGFKLCINEDLFTTTGNLNIDLTYMGFTVESEIPIEGGGGCGGGCGSGGCGTGSCG